MQPFNPAAKCPKCGYDKVETSYREALNVLRRTCERCGYNWNELPLDYSTEAAIMDVPQLVEDLKKEETSYDENEIF